MNNNYVNDLRNDLQSAADRRAAELRAAADRATQAQRERLASARREEPTPPPAPPAQVPSGPSGNPGSNRPLPDSHAGLRT